MLWLALKHSPEPLADTPSPTPAPSLGKAEQRGGAPGTPHAAGTTTNTTHPAAAARSDWLGLWALQFSPRVAWVEEAWLLEVSTTLRLWGGLDGLAKHMHERFSHLNLGGRLQLHAGPSALAALASWRVYAHGPVPKPSAIGQPKRSEAQAPGHTPWPALAPCCTATLPLHALSAARPHVPVLNRLGLHTWAQLEHLPRTGVARRWGPGLLLALDQGLGKVTEGYRWLQAPPVFEQTLECPHALDTTASLMQPVHQLLAALQGWLVQSQQGALALHWQWTHDARRDTPTHGTLELHTAHPTQAVAHWQRLTEEHLAQVKLAAPVLALRLRTLALAPCPNAPTDWLQPPSPTGGSASHGWTELLERLSARLGPHAVVHWQAQPGHWPQTQQRAIFATRTLNTQSGTAAASATPPPWAGPADPTWLLHAPLPLSMAGHRPQHHGPLELLAGPQRLEWTHWPTDTPLATNPADTPAAEYRDYFVARSPQAGLLWVYRCVPTATPTATESPSLSLSPSPSQSQSQSQPPSGLHPQDRISTRAKTGGGGGASAGASASASASASAGAGSDRSTGAGAGAITRAGASAGTSAQWFLHGRFA